MALVKTLRNTVDMLIYDYMGKPKYILMDIDNYLKFKRELEALNLYSRPSPEVIMQGETIVYRDLKVLTVFDIKIIEVVG